MAPVLIVVAFLLLLRLSVELLLAKVNRAEVLRHRDTAPAAAAAIMDQETYRKSVSYTLAKIDFGRIELIWGAIVLAAAVFTGVLPPLYAWFQGLTSNVIWNDTFFLFGVMILLSIPSLPLEWWEQFRLEEKFGFNKSTVGLWIADKLKGLVLGALLGLPLLFALLWVVRRMGPYWWIWGFCLFFGFQLVMLVLYRRLIVPWFNKLTPLPEGELRTRLLALAERTGFRASTIEVIDGSKRSAHSNAYFTGFGRFRRIVFYDTLVEQLTPEELEAVLAHEVGHYRRGHIPKMLAVGAVMTLGAFALIAWLGGSAWFNQAFGFPAGELAPTFLLFALLSGTVTFWFSPLTNHFSRKHEYEADAFARDAMQGPGPIIHALRKLAQKNLSNLTPHPWYSGFYYSHPTLVERERAVGAGK